MCSKIRDQDDRSLEDEDLYWWEIDRSGDAPTTRFIATPRGERLAAFLCSSQYDWQVDLDTQYPPPVHTILDVTS